MDVAATVDRVTNIVNTLSSAISLLQHRQTLVESLLAGQTQDRDLDVSRAHHGLALCRVKFKTWASIWSLLSDQERQDDTFSLEYLWGSTGSGQVLDSLSSIEELLKIVERNLPPPIAPSRTARTRRAFMGRTRTLSRLYVSPKERESLHEVVHRLESTIDSLGELSNYAFQSMHPTASQGQERAQENQLFDQVCDSMSASGTLLECFMDTPSDCGLNLEKQVQQAETWSQQKEAPELQYNVSIDSIDGEPWTLVKGDIISDLSMRVTRKEADQPDDGEKTVHDSTDPVAENPVHFRQSMRNDFVVGFDNRQISSDKTRNLEQLLFSRTDDSAALEPKKAKIDLAYIVAGAALTLIGTPWLSLLTAQNIHRVPLSNGRYEYVLMERNSDPKRALATFSRELRESRHLASVGILLLEIALGTPCRETDDGQTTWPSLVKQLTRVKHVMDPSYCEAAAFCFRQQSYGAILKMVEKQDPGELQQDLKLESMQLLRDYRMEVVERYVAPGPAQTLAKRRRLRDLRTTYS